MGLTYNPNNANIFDITYEKTDYRTDHRTDYKTDNVNHHSQRVCSGPFWRRRCWTTHWTTPNTTLNNQNREMNEGNAALNASNTTLNDTNTKKK